MNRLLVQMRRNNQGFLYRGNAGGNFRDKTIFLFEPLEECENVTSRSRPSTSRRFERLLRGLSA